MQLLVSVRSVVEAEAALAGGADVIDVKEPSRGSLGRADDDVIADVVRTVAGRRIVTAAMGELVDGGGPVTGLVWLKWGLSGVARSGIDWRSSLRNLRTLSGPRVVVVAYADAERAGAPPVTEVCAFACDKRFGVLLLDTCRKDGTTLLDWVSWEALWEMRDRCRSCGVRVALAGALGPQQVAGLVGLRPDFVAVRGAVCEGGAREGRVEAARVRALRACLV